MQIERVEIRNFRRLENVCTSIEETETVFVGPNNSGKTSATAVFRCFLGKRKFQIFDFSVSRMADIDQFGSDGNADALPSIELDIWFRIDPASIEFGRAFTLLPNLTDEFERVGIRMRFGISEPEKLFEAYSNAYPAQDQQEPAQPLSTFLAQDNNLSKHTEISFFSLEQSADDVLATKLDPSEGKALLHSLLRVDFVDAQRNIDDEEGVRANKLSTAFAGFYRNNLEQAEAASEAQIVIDANNKDLTEHYEKQFSGLMDVIKGLGVPAVNDRELRIVSTLSPEEALRGSTDLLYVDELRKHELPEVYNGLGFKNLIYMAIQAKHFHSQWLRTAVNRPLCHIIFIEEPEVHLHAQVQQTFILNVWNVLNASAISEGADGIVPQLVVTTHSSHILDATEFAKVRYFRRCKLAGDEEDVGVLNATEIHSLRDFQPAAVTIEGQTASESEALEFLKKFLRLTHCDLFFADAAILVEGAAEKLLLPAIIDKTESRLKSSYLSVLEIGGAYAHRFDTLLTFLKIPYLVVTDLDSVEAAGHHPVCRADEPRALTSNASLKSLLDVSSVQELNQLSAEQKHNAERDSYVTFQTEVVIQENGASLTMQGRTFEEAIAYQNFDSLRSGELSIGLDELPADLSEAYEAIYAHVKSRKFKKTDFAMGLLAGGNEWVPPAYIIEGLEWLEVRLHGAQPTG